MVVLVLLARYAWFDSGFLFCVGSGVLMDFFLRVGGTRLLKSILSCSPLWPRSSSTTAVVSWFLVMVHLALCSLRLLQAWEWRGRTVNASVANFCPNLENIFMSPLFFAVTCTPSGHCAEEFGSPRYDEELFVVEGSGWRGRQESYSQVTCHPD